MAKTHKNIKKRIKSLEIGLTALKNANNHFQQTKDPSYLLTIQSQLRGLVATGERYMQPLLLNLSEELNIELTLYALPLPENAEKRSSSSVFGKIWSTVDLGGFQKYNLNEWLLRNDYFTLGSMNFKNRNQVIKDTSNNEGGSHYGIQTPHIVESLSKEKVGKLDNLTLTLLDLSELVYFLGNILLVRYKFMEVEKLKIISFEEKNSQLERLKAKEEMFIRKFSQIDNSGKLNGMFIGYNE